MMSPLINRNFSPNHFEAELSSGQVESRISKALNLYVQSEKHRSEKIQKQYNEMMIRSKRVTAQKLKSCSIDSKHGFKESKGPMTVVLGKNFKPVERLTMPI